MRTKFFWMMGVWACLSVWPGQAQETAASDDFFQTAVAKCRGALPVYTRQDKVYLEFPRSVWGRELLITAQIDKGFDLLDRPAQSVGVVRVSVEDEKEVLLEQPLYAERFLRADPEAAPSFRASNYQRNGRKYPVEAVSPEGGLLIDVTRLLATGDEWFSYKEQAIHSLDADHASVEAVHTMDGGVHFVIRRRHDYSFDRTVVSSAAMLLPTGSLPLEVSCTVKLLPEEDAPIRLGGDGLSYRTLSFNDYSQDPYRMVSDSLLVRWRPGKALVLGVDAYFPDEYLPAVRRAVDAWNAVFKEAGLKAPLSLRPLAEDERPAEYDWLLAYDLGEKGVRVKSVHHPRTGEILWGRINIGHGLLADRLSDYWWQEGADDARIDKDLQSKAVACDVLEGELVRALGRLWGLRPLEVDQLFLTDSYRISPVERQAIRYGYMVFPRTKDCYDDRDRLRRRMAGQSLVKADIPVPVQAYADKLESLRDRFVRLDEMPASGLRDLYMKGVRMYGAYLEQLAAKVGREAPAPMQQEAMQLLAKELFLGSEAYESRVVVENMLFERRRYLNTSVGNVFKALLAPAGIRHLERAAWYDADGTQYTADSFFKDLYASLFGDFRPDCKFSSDRQDWMLLCMEVWSGILKEDPTDDNRAGMQRLRQEYRFVHDRLQRLAREHVDARVRHLCALLVATYPA